MLNFRRALCGGQHRRGDALWKNGRRGMDAQATVRASMLVMRGRSVALHRDFFLRSGGMRSRKRYGMIAGDAALVRDCVRGPRSA
ncbi:MAG: hypothetical protein WBO09_00610 [Methylocystis silviterrae]